MIRRREKIIGVLGGMGPEATVEFFQKVVRNTPAAKDQDHLRIIIYNNPKIPDRTPAVLGTGEAILPAMVETAERLVKAGADFIVIPCVTAHYFLDELREEVGVPIVSIVGEVAEEIGANRLRTVGLLSTTGTVKGRIFHSSLEKRGIRVLVPTEKSQKECVMEAIYGPAGIKAGYADQANRERVARAAREMIRAGAEGIIAGCTEIPLVLQNGDLSVPVFDTLLILAKAAIREARADAPLQPKTPLE